MKLKRERILEILKEVEEWKGKRIKLLKGLFKYEAKGLASLNFFKVLLIIGKLFK